MSSMSLPEYRSGRIFSLAGTICLVLDGGLLVIYSVPYAFALGFGFPLEKFVVGGVGDHSGLAVLLDAHLRQRQGRSGDVL